MNASQEPRKRSIVKSITYRIAIALITLTVLFLTTGNIAAATGTTLVLQITNMSFYYIHERVWIRIPWARSR